MLGLGNELPGGGKGAARARDLSQDPTWSVRAPARRQLTIRETHSEPLGLRPDPWDLAGQARRSACRACVLSVGDMTPCSRFLDVLGAFCPC